VTIHLGWMTIVWALAAVGASLVVYIIVGIIVVLWTFRWTPLGAAGLRPGGVHRRSTGFQTLQVTEDTW